MHCREWPFLLVVRTSTHIDGASLGILPPAATYTHPPCGRVERDKYHVLYDFESHYMGKPRIVYIINTMAASNEAISDLRHTIECEAGSYQYDTNIVLTDDPLDSLNVAKKALQELAAYC